MIVLRDIANVFHLPIKSKCTMRTHFCIVTIRVDDKKFCNFFFQSFFFFFPFFYGRLRRINEINTFQLLEPLLPITTAPSIVLSAKQKIRFYSRYRNSRYLDKKFRDIAIRDDHSRVSIITLLQIIRKAYIIYSYYNFAQTFVWVGGCVCACVFILLSSFIIY